MPDPDRYDNDVARALLTLGDWLAESGQHDSIASLGYLFLYLPDDPPGDPSSQPAT